jgi:hypothetical protein
LACRSADSWPAPFAAVNSSRVRTASLFASRHSNIRSAKASPSAALSVPSPDEIGAEHPLAQVLGDLPSAAATRIALQPLPLIGTRKGP